MAELVLTSFRGGLNDSDPPISLPDDQVTLAQNVEFWLSTLGERRKGGDAIAQPGTWPFTDCERIVWLHRHLPTSDPGAAQLWALGINDTGPAAVLAYKDTTWHTVSVSDAFTIDGVSEYQVEGVSLHGKLFIFYNSAVDRLHVWDGTSLRRVGMAAMSTAPTAADSGSGSFATTRYYRVRETVQTDGTTILRSEPSSVLTKTPSGSGSGLTVTKPSTVNTDPAATHWELEAALDNANFYVIATTAIGTTTATDTTDAATGYAASFDLSEDVGDYTPPHSAKHGVADEDRLVIFGSWEQTALQSSMSWTPVYNATGVGNDERIPLDPVSVLNLDGFEGGAITDVGRWAAGSLGVFKEAHVYKVIRTGNRTRAYEAFAESKEIGALPGSVVEGVDEGGNAALYFLDASAGPYRFSVRGGLQGCGGDVKTAWATVNVDATKVQARGVYYRAKKQVQWRVPTGSDNVPTIGLVLQTNEMRLTTGGEARRGFATWTGTGCAALACCLFSDNIDADTTRSRTLVPFIGLEGNGLIWRMDTGDDDNGTEYASRITSKPYAPTNLQTAFEVKTGTLIGKATTGASLTVTAIPDFGLTTSQEAQQLSLTAAGSEAEVIRFMDDLSIAEMRTVQFDIEDVATPGAQWQLAQLTATITAGQGS